MYFQLPKLSKMVRMISCHIFNVLRMSFAFYRQRILLEALRKKLANCWEVPFQVTLMLLCVLSLKSIVSAALF